MEQFNKSGLKPLGRAVLVETYEPERQHSIIALPDSVNRNQQMIEQRAVIIALGENCWCDEPTPRAKVGDKILLSRFAGQFAKGTADDKDYRFVNDRDIFAAIEVES